MRENTLHLFSALNLSVTCQFTLLLSAPCENEAIKFLIAIENFPHALTCEFNERLNGILLLQIDR